MNIMIKLFLRQAQIESFIVTLQVMNYLVQHLRQNNDSFIAKSKWWQMIPYQYISFWRHF